MRISDLSSDVCSSDLGTANFLIGLPIFAVNIALARDGEVIAGVTHVPALGETFRAERGAGAFLNDRPIHVSPRAAMVEAVLAVGIPFAGKPRHEQLVAESTRLTQSASGNAGRGAEAGRRRGREQGCKSGEITM